MLTAVTTQTHHLCRIVMSRTCGGPDHQPQSPQSLAPKIRGKALSKISGVANALILRPVHPAWRAADHCSNGAGRMQASVKSPCKTLGRQISGAGGGGRGCQDLFRSLIETPPCPDPRPNTMGPHADGASCDNFTVRQLIIQQADIQRSAHDIPFVGGNRKKRSFGQLHLDAQSHTTINGNGNHLHHFEKHPLLVVLTLYDGQQDDVTIHSLQSGWINPTTP